MGRIPSTTRKRKTYATHQNKRLRSLMNNEDISVQMRIKADIIMDQISFHVDKELDRFSGGVEYMKDEMTRHVNKQQERYGKLSTEWAKLRDGIDDTET
jgi:hypothetical protein